MNSISNSITKASSGMTTKNNNSSSSASLANQNSSDYHNQGSFTLLKSIPTPSPITSMCVSLHHHQGGYGYSSYGNSTNSNNITGLNLLCTGHKSGQLNLWSAVNGEFNCLVIDVCGDSDDNFGVEVLLLPKI
jgi:hypothetical protein